MATPDNLQRIKPLVMQKIKSGSRDQADSNTWEKEWDLLGVCCGTCCVQLRELSPPWIKE